MKISISACLLALALSTGIAVASEANDEKLVATVNCSVECKGAPAIDSSFESTFEPQKEGLRRGNGNLWSALGTRLWLWSEELCRSKSADACKGEDKVASFKVTNVASGTWNLDSQPTCESGPTQSPFDPAIQVPTAYSGKASVWSKKDSLRWTWKSGDVSQGDKPLEGKCAARIKARTCFGDCMLMNAEKCNNGKVLPEGAHTLCSREPGAKMSLEVCADAILADKADELRAMNPSAREYACRSIFWNSFAKAQPMPYACAAVRGTVDCSDFLNTIENRPLDPVKPSEEASSAGSGLCPACRHSDNVLKN